MTDTTARPAGSAAARTAQPATAQPSALPDPAPADRRHGPAVVDQAAIDRAWLQQAVSLAVENVQSGGGPFGAVIVRDGEPIAFGQNRVTRDLDPTAHAEVTAIRSACRAIGDFSLEGATLYTSCEPCPLCLAASLWARVDRIVFAADRDDAAAGGFDDREFYELFARDRSEWETRVDGIRVDGAEAPFDAWTVKGDRIDY